MIDRLRRWRREAESWYVAIALANLAVGASSVLLPLMVAEVLRGSVAHLGLLSTGASLFGVIGSLIWGRLSDAAHRRKLFIVGSFAVTSFGFATISIIQSFGALVVASAFINFFWVASVAVTVLIVIENREESIWERKIGHLNQFAALGWLAGLMVGTIAFRIGGRFVEEATSIRALYLALSLICMAAAILALQLIPHTESRFVKRKFRGTVVALGNFLIERARYNPTHLYYRLHPKRLPALLWGEQGFSHETKRFLGASVLAFVGFESVFIPLPLLMYSRFNLSASTVFSYYVLFYGLIALSYPVAAKRIHKKGNKTIYARALLARCILFIFMFFVLVFYPGTPHTGILLLFFAVMGVSWSFFQLSGVAFISRLARPGNRGQAIGVYIATAGIGSIVAGVTSGLLAKHIGYWAIFAVASLLIVVAIYLIMQAYSLPPQQESSANKE